MLSIITYIGKSQLPDIKNRLPFKEPVDRKDLLKEERF